MAGLISFLKNIIYKLIGLDVRSDQASAGISAVEDTSIPRCGTIEKEPIIGFEDGSLVMVVDHHFPNVPSWIEWDEARGVISITQMNGDMDEARVVLKKEHFDKLAAEKKMLLISNDNNVATVNFINFIARR